MKKYLILAWNTYYPSLGLGNIKDSTDTFEEALVVFKELINPEDGFYFDNVQIIDRDTLEILKYE